MSVCAILVTHNRRDLLAECLEAVEGQTCPVAAVVVVDNASDDGTPEMLAERFPRVEVARLPVNRGGAAGFREAFRIGLERERHDWLWSMDDDTVPAPDALARLLEAAGAHDGEPPALLASKVLWKDGRMHPMNHPIPRVREMESFVKGAERGLVEIRAATWISLLARTRTVARYGLPHAHYTIWSEDIEWTARVLRNERGYLVPSSVAVHNTATAHTASEGGDRFFYAVRNGLFVIRSRATLTWKEKLLHLVLVAEQVRRYLVIERFRPHALWVVLRGVVHGLTGSAE